ncbi:MAG: transcriptional repressor [Pseudobutyrivibrio sp.]|nr:transcriptional repressor [Pseudobutyrivibrio sp.]
MEEKELIIQQLRDAGCRITKQRLAILDIILNQDPSCCKEIYREAVKVDKNIGSATVYRMVNTLEEIGVLNRKNMYQVDCSSCSKNCDGAECQDANSSNSCSGCGTNMVLTLDDGTHIILTKEELKSVLFDGLKYQNRIANQKIEKILM